MTLDELLSDDTTRDLRLNLRVIREAPGLTPVQAWGAALAAAHAARGASVLRAVMGEAAAHLPPETARAATIAATLMGMNNVYYRFTHLVEAPEYAQMPTALRMQGLATSGAPKLDMELWSLAASIVNGCGACMAAHERTLRANGVTPGMVQAVARIAAVVHAAAAAVEGREALAAVPSV